MNKGIFIDLLKESILDFEERKSEDDGFEIINDVKTFEEALLLTGNNGLIVKLSDGSEFQLTVVKSR